MIQKEEYNYGRDYGHLQREDAIRQFRTGKVWVLICTEVLSRGIDFKGVSLVVNFDLPTSTISYIHRIGKANRDLFVRA